jgi:L-2-hydroxycarboxylate dehydrogenase (NAD+)
MELINERPAMAILDAKGAMGAIVAKRAMEIACERAKTAGVFTLAVRNSPDWMMIGYSSMQALKYDCVGWVYANSRPDVAPWGGTSPVYGHCLISAAIPTANNTGGLKAQEMLMKGQMPPGLYFDANGRRTNDASLWGTENINWGIKGGAQSMSGYRDLALTSVIDAFAGAITGMKCALDLAVPEPVVNGERTPRGQVVMAFDIAAFTDVDVFKAKVDRAIDQAKASPLEEGFDEILMPGERGYREAERRRRDGIPIHTKVWGDVIELSRSRGVDAEAMCAGA